MEAKQKNNKKKTNKQTNKKTTQLWMLLVMEVKFDALKSNIA